MDKDKISTEKLKTPQEYEQFYLPKLEEQNRKSTSEIENFSINIKNRGTAYPQEILCMIDRLKEYEKHFLSYQSLAQYLDNVAKPKMLKRLNDILKDTRGAIQVFQQMYQNTLHTNIEIFRIQRDVQQYSTKIMKEVHDHGQKIFEESNKKWHDVFIGRSIDHKYCPYCGYDIGYYHSYTYCPDCGKRLI